MQPALRDSKALLHGHNVAPQLARLGRRLHDAQEGAAGRRRQDLPAEGVPVRGAEGARAVREVRDRGAFFCCHCYSLLMMAVLLSFLGGGGGGAALLLLCGIVLFV